VNGLAVTSDANGSATGFGSDVYTWDVRNRLVKLTRPGLTVELTYDPFGNRTSKKVNGTLTKFLLDRDSLVSEVTGATTVNTLQGPTLDQPLSRNGRFFAPNELGSTTKLTDGAGGVVQTYDYSPFGETTPSTGEANPFQYAGRENDNTGLYYNRARYYVPEWGRFMSEDPLGFEGGLNRFTYADNNPLGATDPMGLSYAPVAPRSGLQVFLDWWNEDPPPPIWTGAFWQRFWHNLKEDILSDAPPVTSLGPVQGPARFRGPAEKGFDWDHIFDQHAEWGASTKQPGYRGSIFRDLTAEQIKLRVQAAWKVRKKVETVMRDSVTRIKYQGVDPVSGQRIGFWFNAVTQIVESAWPID